MHVMFVLSGSMCGLICFRVNFGVRQKSVLSPFHFALYLDDLAKSFDRARNVFIILYADNILLLPPSVSELDNILKICE